MKRLIPVTQPFLPPIEEYQALISEIWSRNHLTNHGPLLRKLENEISSYLHLPNFIYVANGTLALQLAIRALSLRDEIITTPFSYVATSSSIIWEGCQPVFVDIEEDSFNINAELIENAITNKTSGILATHVYGNPCDIDRISEVAKKYDLKVIYDAAHCFGSTYKSKSVMAYGDISTASFHATKLFHTVEGGGIFSNDKSLIERAFYMSNFGHSGLYNYEGLGINAKNSEIHAAMGLINLKYADKIIEKRKSDYFLYKSLLTDVIFLKDNPHSKPNYSYLPIVFKDETTCLKVSDALSQEGISSRRYFYPLLSNFEYIANSAELSIAEEYVKRVICLPMYFELRVEDIEHIADIVNQYS